MKKILPILIIISFLVANSVEAVAVKVKPSEMKIETNIGVLAKQEIIVENPGDNVALFEIYVDNFSDWIRIKPESFILETKESQRVILEIQNKEGGIFSTMISVVAKPLSERKFKANSGVKIPLEVRISEGKSESWLASILKNFGRLSKNPWNLIYVFSFIFILVLFGIWLGRKEKTMRKEKQAPRCEIAKR